MPFLRPMFLMDCCFSSHMLNENQTKVWFSVRRSISYHNLTLHIIWWMDKWREDLPTDTHKMMLVSGWNRIIQSVKHNKWMTYGYLVPSVECVLNVFTCNNPRCHTTMTCRFSFVPTTFSATALFRSQLSVACMLHALDPTAWWGQECREQEYKHSV